MSRNYLEVTEQWKQQQIAIARDILRGRVKYPPEQRDFYEGSARRTLAHYGVPVEAPAEEEKENTGQREVYFDGLAGDDQNC